MNDPIKVNAERMTPEEEAVAKAKLPRRAKVKSMDPVPPQEVDRARRRGFAIGVVLAVSAGVAASVGYLLWGKRKSQRRNNA